MTRPRALGLPRWSGAVGQAGRVVAVVVVVVVILLILLLRVDGAADRSVGASPLGRTLDGGRWT